MVSDAIFLYSVGNDFLLFFFLNSIYHLDLFLSLFSILILVFCVFSLLSESETIQILVLVYVHVAMIRKIRHYCKQFTATIYSLNSDNAESSIETLSFVKHASNGQKSNQPLVRRLRNLQNQRHNI